MLDLWLFRVLSLLEIFDRKYVLNQPIIPKAPQLSSFVDLSADIVRRSLTLRKTHIIQSFRSKAEELYFPRFD